MERVKTIMKKVIAVLVTFVIIMSQYVITGLIEVSYAIDLLATQNNNVQFRAYFKNGEEELTEIEKSIDAKDVKLKIDVAVKTQGYFNGQISFENAGFKITQTTENNYINKVENGVIYLNQINAEETASIEVGIEYLDEEKIEVSTLNRDTNVKLTGTYTHSGGNQTINGASPVKVVWKIPEGTKAELAGKVQTNSIYKVGEENKKVVQFLISSEVTNNCYPIKSTEIIATKPEGVTKVEVHKRTTKATNGEQEFEEANNVRQEGNNVIIKVENNEIDGKVSWLKGVNDVFVVTYEYPESADLSAEEILINSKITTYSQDKTTGNNIELNGEQVQLQLNETKDGIASIIKQEKENQIYKGKIYAGEEREITSYTLAYVDYVEGIKEIELIEEEAKYTKEVEENGETNQVDVDANVEIKTIKVNKQEIEKVLGETWNITIGEITITNTTEVDGNGNIEVTLPNGTKTATMKTSKPVNNGMFVIELKKVIKDTTNTREEKKELTLLKDICSVKYTKNNDDKFTFTYTYKIGLKDTESKASIQSEQQALIASDEAQQLNLTAVLESSGEHQDLYKNPTIKIKLPRQITSVTYTQKPDLLYANNVLTIEDGDYTIGEENGQKVINIKLTGEQTRYLGDAIQGTTVLVKTNVKVNNNTQDSEEEIILNYTNENATKYTDNGIEKTKIQIMASSNQNQGQNQEQQQSQGQNQNQGQNQQTQNNTQQENQSEIRAELKSYVGGEAIGAGEEIKAGEIVQYVLNITNNINVDINNYGFDITIPNEAALLVYNPEYPRQNPEQDGAYYLDGEFFAKREGSNLTEQGISIKAGETYTYKYMVEISKNISEQKNIETNVNIKKNGDTISNISLQNVVKPANLKVSVRPLFRKYGDDLKPNIDHEYLIEIENITGIDQENVKVTMLKNDTVTISKTEWYIKGQEDTDGTVISYSENNVVNISKIPANKKAEIIIDTLESQNSDDVVYAQFSAIVEDSLNNRYRANKLIEKIVGLRIGATIEKEILTEKQSDFVKSGDKIKYLIKIKNTGYLDAEELEIEDHFSQYLTLKSLTLNGNEPEYNIEPIVSEEYNVLRLRIPLNAKNEATIEITGEVNDNLPNVNNLKITNKVIIYGEGSKLVETDELTDTIGQDGENGKDDNNDGKDDNKDDENSQNDNNNSGNNAQGNSKSISGIAWIDDNGNGRRDEEENILKDLTVILLNLDKNTTRNTKTQEDGKYIFDSVENGRYVVIFEYDTGKYILTKYNASGVDSSKNSDVENITITINGVKKKVASTDTFTIVNNSLTNIDIGLKTSKVFDLELDKTITKITVTNSSGTKVYKYKNTDLAKAEIKSKYLNGSIVNIEYKIRVKNNGEIPGYARKIVDYKSKDLEFNSKYNKNWKKSGDNLYTDCLANTIINPGESKEVTLILTKKMTNSNTGLTNNMAEITEEYNAQGISDIDSKPNNKQGNEDDLGQANAIISISTGKTIGYIIITLIATIGIGVLVYINLKKAIFKKVIL